MLHHHYYSLHYNAHASSSLLQSSLECSCLIITITVSFECSCFIVTTTFFICTLMLHRHYHILHLYAHASSSLPHSSSVRSCFIVTTTFFICTLMLCRHYHSLHLYAHASSSPDSTAVLICKPTGLIHPCTCIEDIFKCDSYKVYIYINIPYKK